MAASPAPTSSKLRLVQAAFSIVLVTALVLSTVHARRVHDDIDEVLITFKLGKNVAYGRGFVIAGNTTVLGNWDVQAAPLMEYYGPDEYGYNWKVDVTFTPGEWIEFKPVEVYYDSKQVVCWYPGNNIFYQIGTHASKGTVFLGVDTFPDCNAHVIKEVTDTA